MVAPSDEFRGEPVENPLRRTADRRFLAVHRIGKHPQLATEGLDDALQSQTHTKNRQPAPHAFVDQLRHAEFLGRAWPRRDEDQIGIKVGEDALGIVQAPRTAAVARPRGAYRHHLRSRLPHVIAERMDERVAIIDKEHPLALARGHDLGAFLLGVGGTGHRVDKGLGLGPRLTLFSVGVRVAKQSRPSPYFGSAILQVYGADSDPSVDLAAEEQHADATTVPAPRRVFQFLDLLHGRRFGRAGERHRPHMRKQGVESVAVVLQLADDLVHGVKDL